MGDPLSLVPTRTYHEHGEVCGNGDECAGALFGQPVVLSRYNVSSTCYCCQQRARRIERRRKEQRQVRAGIERAVRSPLSLAKVVAA